MVLLVYTPAGDGDAEAADGAEADGLADVVAPDGADVAVCVVAAGEAWRRAAVMPRPTHTHNTAATHTMTMGLHRFGDAAGAGVVDDAGACAVSVVGRPARACGMTRVPVSSGVMACGMAAVAISVSSGVPIADIPDVVVAGV